MGLYTRIVDIDDAIDDLIDMENEFEAINIGTSKDFVKGLWDGLMDMIPDSLLGWVLVGAAILIGAGLLYVFGPIVLVIGGVLAMGFAVYGSYELYQEGNSLAYSIGHGLPMAIMGTMGMKGGAAAMAESGWASTSSYGKVGNLFTSRGGSSFNINVKPTVENTKLQNTINDLYKGQNRSSSGNQIGNGTTMDAIRYEKNTGKMVGGRTHTMKGTQKVSVLERIIRRKDISEKDKEIAKFLLEDLKDALGEERK